MDESELPEVIATYQRAHDGRDTEAALATFGPAATVEDDGQTYEGTERIRAGSTARPASSPTSARSPAWKPSAKVRRSCATTWRATSPGGQVDLQYRFRVDAGLITNLVIAP